MKSILALVLALSGATIVATGCGGGNNGNDDIDARAPIDGSGIDGAITDGGVPDADCVMNPVTNAQLMNACTDSERIEKTPTTGCWDTNGALPGLP
jgi:hypothetical protein